MNNVTRDDIADFLNQEFGLSKLDCNSIVNDLIEEMIKGLQLNRKIKIHNFGSFLVKTKKERIGRNPKTKEVVMIKSRNVVSFVPSKKIILFLNKNFDEQ